MSVCGTATNRIPALGLASTTAGLLLYQLDHLKVVERWRAGVPLHAAQGLLLGMGLVLTVGGLLRRRKGV